MVGRSHQGTSELRKVCPCGAVYDTRAWRALTLVGDMRSEAADALVYELRNCPCGSTLAALKDS